MDEPGDADVGSIQPHTHSFLVKVWLVDPERGPGRSGWRGRITHVPTGRHRHFATMNGLASFITRYLHAMGVRPTPSSRLRRWLRGDRR